MAVVYLRCAVEYIIAQKRMLCADLVRMFGDLGGPGRSFYA